LGPEVGPWRKSRRKSRLLEVRVFYNRKSVWILLVGVHGKGAISGVMVGRCWFSSRISWLRSSA